MTVGCAADGGGDDSSTGGKGDGNGECVDPMYGDGVCQLDLGCGIPDVDCFQTFENDAAAAAWFAPQDKHPVITDPADPRFVRTRALVDQAWDAFKRTFPMGKLGEGKLALVLIEDPEINAFAMSDFMTGKAALSIQVQTGLFVDGFTDNEILGVLFHELEHLHGLHVLPEVPDKLRRYYLAGDVEPIGHTMIDQTAVRTEVEAWSKLAGFAGAYTSQNLGELALDGSLASVFDYLLSLHSSKSQCADEIIALWDVEIAITDGYREIDQTYPVDATRAAEIRAKLAALSNCLVAFPFTLQQLLDKLGDKWTAYFDRQLAADEKWLLPESAFEALTLLVDDRHAKQRAIEAKLAWDKVRFYSTEEAADDASQRVTSAEKLDTIGVSGLMTRLMKPDEVPQCEAAIAAGAAPYGVNLADEHHGSCWRIAHARQLGQRAPHIAVLREPHVAHLDNVARRVY